MTESVPLEREGVILLPRVRVATGFIERFLGLMGRKNVTEDEGLCFPKCNSIHTFFMRIPIDVVLLDKKGAVVEIVAAMAPWRMLLPRLKVAHVLELRAGRCAQLGIERGHQLICKGAWG